MDHRKPRQEVRRSERTETSSKSHVRFSPRQVTLEVRPSKDVGDYYGGGNGGGPSPTTGESTAAVLTGKASGSVNRPQAEMRTLLAR